MKKTFKTVGRFFLSVLLTMVLVIGFKIAVDGCWLIFLPIDDKVETFTIEYPSLSPETREITDASDLKKCTAMLNTLKYDVFQQAHDTSAPLVTYTYHLKDGSDLVVSANNETVFFKGKQHVLKENESFVKITAGLLFPSETVE